MLPFKSLLCCLAAGAALLTASAASAQSDASPWDETAAILARIKAPEFPARDFTITDPKYGAIADGVTDATAAIANAIADCNAAGGGRVVVPAGKFLTGPITLKSNVNLHVAKGATLFFKTDTSAFPVVRVRWEGTECMNYSPLIYAFEQENIAVTGEGTLDGQASYENWWASKKPKKEYSGEQGNAGVPPEKTAKPRKPAKSVTGAAAPKVAGASSSQAGEQDAPPLSLARQRQLKTEN